jgi:hypothetical protein
MGMLMDSFWQLVRSGLTLVQVIIAGILLGAVWVPVAVVVGALNLLLVLVRGDGFDNIDLLFEPLEWYLHQLMVLVGAADDFWAIPYSKNY